MTSWLAGIDISHHQSSTPSLGGLDFAFCRATYGTSWDTRYVQHAGNVKAAGVVLGAYHFGRSTQDPVKQAEAFLASMSRVPTKLVALDVELDVHPDRPADPAMSRVQAAAFIAHMRSKGYTCGLYHSESGFFDAGQDFDWVANWSRTPTRPWDFHQYRGSPLDLDYCRWTESELRLAEQGLPDTATGGYMGTIVIRQAPYMGTFSIPAGRDVEGLVVDLATGAITSRIPWTPQPSPSSAHFDAYADLSGVGIRGNPFLRVTDGVFAGAFLSTAGLTVIEGVPPPPDCTAEVDAATLPLRSAIQALESRIGTANERLRQIRANVGTEDV